MVNVTLVDDEPFQNRFTIPIQSDLSREIVAANCALVSQSLAFLNKIRFNAEFNSIPTRDLTPKEFSGGRLVKTKLARAPMFAIFFGHYCHVYGLAVVIGGLKPWNALRRDTTEFIAEDDIIASEQIARIYRHDAQQDRIAGDQRREWRHDHRNEDNELETNTDDQYGPFPVLDPLKSAV